MQQAETIRVLIIDDHTLFRLSLREVLRQAPDLSVVGEAENGAGAVELAQRTQPDVVLMDIEMPFCDGLEATGELAFHCPEVRTMMLTRHNEYLYLSESFRLGARGYALKTRTPNEIVDAIRRVYGGSVYIDPDMAQEFQEMLMGSSSRDVRARPVKLSAREREVTGLIAQGFVSQEIAERLDISVASVGTYRMRVMRKLAFRSKAELVRYAMREGMLET